MGLLTADDYAEMQADLAEVRGDNEQNIVIRRGGVELPPQPVRIARQGSQAQPRDSDNAQEVRGKVVVMGGVDFDVQPEDRFNDAGGGLCRVVFVRPNRRVMVVAEAEVIG